jgi:hypothetical protein
VGHHGAETSNSFICSKFSSFAPDWLETTLFQNGCLTFRSPASSDLCLQLKSSVMSASFQAWPGDLQTAASSTYYYESVCNSLWLLLKQVEEGTHGCWECLFSLQRQFRLFLLGSGQSDESDNLE